MLPAAVASQYRRVVWNLRSASPSRNRECYGTSSRRASRQKGNVLVMVFHIRTVMHPGGRYLVCAMVAPLLAQRAHANHAAWNHLL
ncbi:hypothetical protein KCU83_g90, partial [Aureobasidium melanogenum]